jgi:three-Cys-motif partner protein
MPIENGVGYSKYTDTKQVHFKQIVSTLLAITEKIVKKNTWAYPTFQYYDLNGGPGYNPEGSLGSPLIFCEVARQFNLNYQMHLFENNSISFNRLCKSVNNSPYQNGQFAIKYYNIDHNEYSVPSLCTPPPTQFGLIYNDPTGNMPSFEFLSTFSRIFPRIDILINCPCSTIKRTRKCSKVTNSKTLLQHLVNINKKYWLVREPHDKHQWSFVLGTNWANFPALEKIGLYKSHSEKGRQIIQVLNLTHKERQECAY